MTTPPPPQPPYQPTTGTWPYLSSAPATVQTTVVHHYVPAQPVIPVLPDDHHDTVDWQRLRRGARVLLRPSCVVGLALSPLWAGLVLPLVDSHGLPAAVGLGFMTCVWTAVGLAVGRLPRPLLVLTLAAVGAGTAELLPAALIHYLLMEH